MPKLVPCIGGRESPVDGCPSLVSFGLQGCNFPFERPLIFNTAIQTLVADDVSQERNLEHLFMATCPRA